MAWSDAARAAAAMVRRTHARALAKAMQTGRTPEGRSALYKASEKQATRYQMASSLRYARAGVYAPHVAKRVAKQAAAASALQRLLGKRKS